VAEKKKEHMEKVMDDNKETKSQLRRALIKHNETGKRLETILEEEGIVNEETVRELLKYRFSIVPIVLTVNNVQDGVPALINGDLARKFTVIPFKKSSFKLLVAMVDPYDFDAIDEVQRVSGFSVLPRKADKEQILEMIDHFYPKKEQNTFKESKKEELLINQ
jgi:type IV pilus assembly protein PilB